MTTRLQRISASLSMSRSTHSDSHIGSKVVTYGLVLCHTHVREAVSVQFVVQSPKIEWYMFA